MTQSVQPAGAGRSLVRCVMREGRGRGSEGGRPPEPAPAELLAAASGAAQHAHTACLLPCTAHVCTQSG